MTTAPVGCLDEREAFEAWAGDQGFVLTRTVHGDDYQDLRTQGPWEAWQAHAARSASRQEGWQLVPVEPTDAMLRAGNKKTWPLPSQDVYRAMLAAAPRQSQEAQGDRHGE
jgi:hypothetical protein